MSVKGFVDIHGLFSWSPKASLKIKLKRMYNNITLKVKQLHKLNATSPFKVTKFT